MVFAATRARKGRGRESSGGTHRATDVPVLDVLPHELQRVLRRGLRRGACPDGLLHDGDDLVLTEVGRERLLPAGAGGSGFRDAARGEAAGDERHRVVRARFACAHWQYPNRINVRLPRLRR